VWPSFEKIGAETAEIVFGENKTRKLCYRKETARCSSCCGLKFADIHYKFKFNPSPGNSLFATFAGNGG